MRPWVCHFISLSLFLSLQGGDKSNYLPPGGRERLNELMFMKYSILSSVSTVVFYQLLIEYWMFFQFSWRQFQKFSSHTHVLVHEVPILWLELESPLLIRIFHFKHISNSQKHYPNKSPSQTESTDFGTVISLRKYTILNTGLPLCCWSVLNTEGLVPW